MPETGIGTTIDTNKPCPDAETRACARPPSATEQPLGNTIARWRKQRSTLQRNMRTTLMNSGQGISDNNLDLVLQGLCTELIDYVSTGHFSVYKHPLGFAASKRSELNSILHNIYQYIGSTTDQVLQFNDRVEAIQPGTHPDSLRIELRKLNKSLSVRFALEEQLLELGSPG